MPLSRASRGQAGSAVHPDGVNCLQALWREVVAKQRDYRKYSIPPASSCQGEEGTSKPLPVKRRYEICKIHAFVCVHASQSINLHLTLSVRCVGALSSLRGSLQGTKWRQSIAI